MSAGFVYVLSNPSLRGETGALIFKVGGTSRTPRRRAAELSASCSIPERFKVVLEERCRDWKTVECAVHLRLRPFWLNREFFCAPLETIAEALRHALVHLEPAGETVAVTPAPLVSSCVPVQHMSSIIELRLGGATTATLYPDVGMLNFSSPYGTIDLDLPLVPRRVRADRARRIRAYLQRSMAEELFRKVRPILEPDVTLFPNHAGIRELAINDEPAFRITLTERTRWLSRRRQVSATARCLPGFCGDLLWPSEITRTGPALERDATVQAVQEGAVRAYVHHALRAPEEAPLVVARWEASGTREWKR